MLIDPVIVKASQAVAAVVFGVAAIAKLRQIERFERALESYALLPAGLLPVLAWALALAELAVALALPLDVARRAAAAGGMLLLAVFAAAIAINLARGRRDIDCGCWAFGQRDDAARIGLTPWHLLRLACLCAVLALSLFESTGRAIVWIDYLSVVGSLVAVVGVFFATDWLLANGAAAQRMRS